MREWHSASIFRSRPSRFSASLHGSGPHVPLFSNFVCLNASLLSQPEGAFRRRIQHTKALYLWQKWVLSGRESLFWWRGCRTGRWRRFDWRIQFVARGSVWGGCTRKASSPRFTCTRPPRANAKSRSPSLHTSSLSSSASNGIQSVFVCSSAISVSPFPLPFSARFCLPLFSRRFCSACATPRDRGGHQGLDSDLPANIARSDWFERRWFCLAQAAIARGRGAPLCFCRLW